MEAETCLKDALLKAASNLPSKYRLISNFNLLYILLTVQSLRKKMDFQRVMKSGESWSDRNFVLIATNQISSSVMTRFGFSVSKRIGNAVIRNQMKRRLRSIVYKFDYNEGWNAVLIARKGSIGCTYKEIESSVSRLLIKSGMATDRLKSKTR